MWTPDYYIRTVKLPRTVGGAVVPNDDGTFDIYLNERETEENRRRWLAHELRHIRLDHFYRGITAAEAEREADGAAPHRASPGLLRFDSPEDLLRYYREEPDRLYRDYGGNGPCV